jgi:hypothetical protein
MAQIVRGALMCGLFSRMKLSKRGRVRGFLIHFAACCRAHSKSRSQGKCSVLHDANSDGRRAEFVAGFKNGAWHIEKVKREYGITKISVFHRFFPGGVCPAGAISKTTPIDQ